MDRPKANVEEQSGFAPFADALLDPDIAIPGKLGDVGGRPSAKRFGIYRNNVVVSLMEALAAAYPSVKAIMGEENFRRVCRNHVMAHPPNSPLMIEYGAAFPDYLDGFPPLRNIPYLGDVARLERAWLAAYHAIDATPLAPETLSGVPSEQSFLLTFEVHPATAFIASQWPVADLFFWRNGKPNAGADLSKKQNAVVTRPGLEVLVNPVADAGLAIFQSLADGATLGEAAAAAYGLDDDFDLPAAIAFALDAGMFTEARVKGRVTGAAVAR